MQIEKMKQACQSCSDYVEDLRGEVQEDRRVTDSQVDEPNTILERHKDIVESFIAMDINAL